jgi:hypothetical protein
MPKDRGRGRRGQVPNEEVPYHDHNIRDVTIEDLQRQVAELTQRLAAQNLEMHRDIDGRNAESNFESPYHNTVLIREQHGRDEWHGDLGFRVELSEFSDTLTVVSKSQAHLPNPSYLEEEDEIIEQDFSVDLVSPPIYDIYPDEEDLLEEVNLFIDTIKIVEDNDIYHVFDKSSKSKISQWGIEKINCFDFLGIEIFLSSFPEQNLDIGFGMLEDKWSFHGQERIDNFWKNFMESEFMTINQELVKIILSQVGANNFRSNIQSHVVMGCKLFLFRYQVALVLKNSGWHELIGHPKDRGKDDLNSRTNSFQLGETDAGEYWSILTENI